MSLEQQMAQQYKAFAKQNEEQDALAEVLLPLPLLLCGCCCDGAGVLVLLRWCRGTRGRARTGSVGDVAQGQ